MINDTKYKEQFKLLQRSWNRQIDGALYRCDIPWNPQISQNRWTNTIFQVLIRWCDFRIYVSPQWTKTIVEWHSAFLICIYLLVMQQLQYIYVEICFKWSPIFLVLSENEWFKDYLNSIIRRLQKNAIVFLPKHLSNKKILFWHLAQEYSQWKNPEHWTNSLISE